MHRADRRNTIVDGKMSAGFASSLPCGVPLVGVMTFIVDASGIYLRKDLGPNTTKLAAAMTALTRIPLGSWR